GAEVQFQDGSTPPALEKLLSSFPAAERSGEDSSNQTEPKSYLQRKNQRSSCRRCPNEHRATLGRSILNRTEQDPKKGKEASQSLEERSGRGRSNRKEEQIRSLKSLIHRRKRNLKTFYLHALDRRARD
ncbi:unnamed protein product, partial [Brassica napus]